ncbi:MAG: diguanylate cyclase domain-containing protein [Cyanophyceae cyanobacterium]
MSRALGLPSVTQLEQQLTACRNELETVNRQQQAVYNVISKIRASLDTKTIFCTATKETCRLLGIERVTVYRFTSEWSGEFVDGFEFIEPGWEELSVWKKGSTWNDTYLKETTGNGFQKSKALYISDVYEANLSPCHVETLERFGIRAYATCPIFVGEKLWGILGAYQHSEPHQWKEHEMMFLSQVASQLGFAVKQSQLLKNTSDKALALKQANALQGLLLQLTAEIRDSLELDVLFKTTVKEVRRVMGADRVGIFRFDLETKYHCGEFIAESVLPAYGSALSCKVRDRCFGDQYFKLYQQGRLQILNDIRAAGLSDCHIEILQQFQIQAQIIVPLFDGEILWGLLCIHQCGDTRRWLTTEVDFVRQLAAQFSVALDHANLHSQVRSQADRLVGMVRSLETLNAELREIGKVDKLTQIPNRRAFDDCNHEEWLLMMQQRRPLTVILIDIDFFKCFNDAFGHVEGDRCLQQVAQAIYKTVSAFSGLAARYGGEEFAAVLPCTGRESAVAIAQQIKQTIQDLGIPAPGAIHRHADMVTASLGVASMIPEAGRSPQCLVELADIALYQAKEDGRNTWRTFQSQKPFPGNDRSVLKNKQTKNDKIKNDKPVS